MRKIMWLLLMVLTPALVNAAPPGFMKERMGTLTGKIVVEGDKALAGGIVSFFNVETGPPPLLPGGTRVPDAVARVDGEGGFSARLVPGSYYLGGLQVAEPGRGPGPPRAGEKFYYAVDAAGGLRTFMIETRKHHELGRISVLPPAKLAGELEFFTLSGIVLGPDGEPFAEAVVLVKKNPAAMRPDFASEPVGIDGRFSLRLPPGTYYLMARQVVGNSIMGQPVAGSYVGTYGVDSAPAGGMPGSAGPSGGIVPPGGVGPRLTLGPATGINPAAAVEPGEAEPVTGKAGEEVEGVTIRVYPVPRPDREEAASYFKVKGMVVDQDGRPIRGMQVHAKESFTDFRPPFTSGATDREGAFMLELPAGKKYYLLARPPSVGPPRPGMPVGFYGLTRPIKELLVFLNPGQPDFDEYFEEAKAVTGNAAETVSGVKITVFPMGGGEAGVPLPR